MKMPVHFPLLTLLFLLFTAACAQQTQTPAASSPTGREDLDRIITAALAGDHQTLLSLIDYTSTHCTTADGLGGPPGCREGEAEGTPLEVLPVLGSEGSFIRKEEIGNWAGLQNVSLYAVYSTADPVFEDANYPLGDYAIVFTSAGEPTRVTLQVIEGRIVRLDYGLNPSPSISADFVEEYLVAPVDP